jgi:hypothetical protein
MIDALDQFPCSPSAFGVRLTASPKGFRRFREIVATGGSSAISFQGQRGRERGHLPANAIRLVLERSDRRRPSGRAMTKDHLP